MADNCEGPAGRPLAGWRGRCLPELREPADCELGEPANWPTECARANDAPAPSDCRVPVLAHRAVVHSLASGHHRLTTKRGPGPPREERERVCVWKAHPWVFPRPPNGSPYTTRLHCRTRRNAWFPRGAAATGRGRGRTGGLVRMASGGGLVPQDTAAFSYLSIFWVGGLGVGGHPVDTVRASLVRAKVLVSLSAFLCSIAIRIAFGSIV